MFNSISPKNQSNACVKTRAVRYQSIRAELIDTSRPFPPAEQSDSGVKAKFASTHGTDHANKGVSSTSGVSLKRNQEEKKRKNKREK